MERDNLKAVIEAVIFAADHPVSIDRLAGVLEGEPREEIRAAVRELVEEYAAGAEAEGELPQRGIYIEEVAGGFQLRTRAEHAPWIKRFFKVGAQKISKAAMETLAIIAYKQPLARAELESIRGVDSAGVLKTLLERRLVKIVGRQDAPGRPVLYGTTKEFLEAFELNDLTGLPTLGEIKEFDEEGELDDEQGSGENADEGTDYGDKDQGEEKEPRQGSAEEAVGEETVDKEESDEESVDEESAGKEAVGEEAYDKEESDEESDEPKRREASEDNSRCGDNLEAQGRGDDTPGQGEGKQENNR